MEHEYPLQVDAYQSYNDVTNIKLLMVKGHAPLDKRLLQLCIFFTRYECDHFLRGEGLFLQDDDPIRLKVIM